MNGILCMRPTILYSFAFTEFLPSTYFFPVNVLCCAEKKHTQNQRKFIVRAQAPNPCFLRYLFKKKILGNGKAHFDLGFCFWLLLHEWISSHAANPFAQWPFIGTV